MSYIEPEAKNSALSISEQAALSTAISLKRLADVAEKLTGDTHDAKMEFMSFMWEAGRSFQSGTRSDR